MDAKLRPSPVAHAAEPGAAQAAAQVPAARAGSSDGLRRAAGQAPFVLAGIAVAAAGSAPLAVAWCVASRLAYVLFVGFSLRAETNGAARSRRLGPEAAWLRFRAWAERLMLGDVFAIAALCLVTRGTLAVPGPAWLAPAAGLALIVLGIGVKVWATRSLDEGIFYWRDFFVPGEHLELSAAGPYRWISNPMYTVGYAHAYGFALLLGSLAGLVAAAFAQVAILLLARLVERPQVRRLGAR